MWESHSKNDFHDAFEIPCEVPRKMKPKEFFFSKSQDLDNKYGWNIQTKDYKTGNSFPS